MSAREPQQWGFWTRAKLDVLRDYLAAFLTASSGTPGAVYLDAFAGEGSGRDRLTSREFDGSARIAADATANGTSDFRFTHLRFFEQHETKAAAVQADLRARAPGRDIRVIPGDCNVTLPQVLREMPASMRRAPTFAFLDPFGTELSWQTIRAIAEHKAGLKYKVEFWMLFSSPGMMRVAGNSADKAAVGSEQLLTGLFGNTAWRDIVDQRRSGHISPAGAREAFVNLMRWQLEEDLGYAYTHALEIKNETGSPVYHMIFATDVSAGDRIIRDLYRKAAVALPLMAQEARQQRKGVFTLFPVAGTAPPVYEHEPPAEPDDLLVMLMTENQPPPYGTGLAP